MRRDVPFGSKADIATSPSNVRFTPESGHSHTPINPLHIRRSSDLVAGSCYFAPARANKSSSRYRRPKTERCCIEACPGRDARTRQTKLQIRIWRTRLSYDRGCQHLLGIFLIHHIERTEHSLLHL